MPSRAYHPPFHAGFVQEAIIPIAEYIKEGEEEPVATPIIGRDKCLDFCFVADSMKPSIVSEFMTGGVPHWLCNVLKPYSEILHVLTIRSDHQWAPTPSFYDQAAGAGVCRVAGEVLRYAAKFGKTGCWGWNSSPFYYVIDGFSCFASIPSLWHPQTWVMGDVPMYLDKPLAFSRWSPMSAMTPVQRRALVENDYGIQFCKTLYYRLTKAKFAHHFPLRINDRVPDTEPYFTPRGITIELSDTIGAMLRDPGFFTDVVQPLDRLIYDLMADIHEAMFEMEFARRIEIMQGANSCSLPDDKVAVLTSIAPIRSLSEASRRFNEAQIDDRLLAVLWPWALNLANKEGANTERLIQGPAYSVVFAENFGSGKTYLTIMPGFPQGNGGVVEALGILLSRPNYKMSLEEMRARSARLYPLTDILQYI